MREAPLAPATGVGPTPSRSALFRERAAAGRAPGTHAAPAPGARGERRVAEATAP